MYITIFCIHIAAFITSSNNLIYLGSPPLSISPPRLSAMQELKRNLTATANQTVANQLALGEGSLALHIALGNITSSIRQMALTDPGSDQTTNHSAEVSVAGYGAM
jgi:hypothetical protein